MYFWEEMIYGELFVIWRRFLETDQSSITCWFNASQQVAKIIISRISPSRENLYWIIYFHNGYHLCTFNYLLDERKSIFCLQLLVSFWQVWWEKLCFCYSLDELAGLFSYNVFAYIRHIFICFREYLGLLIFLYTFITGSILMCLILFHFLTTKVTVFTALIDIIYLETIVTQTWLLCFYGQKLIDSSSGVADAIYDSDWTEVDDCYFKKQIVLILIRSQRPKRLSAMGFADISLETFAAVSNLILRRFIYQLTFLLPQILSSTYSYFSLLRTVFSENWNVKVLCRRETNKLRTMSAYIREIIQRLQQ